MKSFRRAGALVIAICMSVISSVNGDDELDRLKAAASESVATLEFKEGRAKTRDGIEYLLYSFKIDTQTKQYLLQYKTFSGTEAQSNISKLNDASSGYGMCAPNNYWYFNGFINAMIKSGGKVCDIRKIEGCPAILEQSGKRVAYDIKFKDSCGSIVIRTVALAGKDELYIAIFGKSLLSDSGILESQLYGYPFGLGSPRERVIYGENLEINKDPENRVELKSAPWLLFSDKLKEDKNEAGMLGVVFDKKTVNKTLAHISGNYRVNTAFVNQFGGGAARQYCMIFTFGKITAPDARKSLAEIAEAADKAFEAAFNGLPEPAL